MEFCPSPNGHRVETIRGMRSKGTGRDVLKVFVLGKRGSGDDLPVNGGPGSPGLRPEWTDLSTGETLQSDH